MPYIETANRPALFYRDWGAGRPVLFCSAWALSGVEFEYQMFHFAENGFRALSYDRRGHGRSDDAGAGYDYDTLADDLAVVIEHLDLAELTLVAHSMAGGEVVRYLTRHGAERVSRIVLIAATLPFPLRTESNPDGVGAAVFENSRAQWRRDFGKWLTDNAGPYVGDGLPGCAVSQAARDWTISDMLTTSFKALFDCNRAVVETDFRPELADVTVPTLIIQGDHDASIPFELSGAKQAALMPHSQVIVYENAPHGLYLSHRDRLNQDLLEFVAAGAASLPAAA